MKLIYRIAIRLSMVLLPLLALWASLFYYKMVSEINDEADDMLEDYSESIIIRMLANQRLPQTHDGSNNSYTIRPVDGEYANSHSRILYYDSEVYIPEKKDTEPARILTTIFEDNNGLFYELKVETPTFEREDLMSTILLWVVLLYFALLISVLLITVFVFQRNLRPLYGLLHWLDSYVPGQTSAPLPNDVNIQEFKKLNEAAQKAMDRSDELHRRQSQFIGNASHELQTPLAVLGNRMEWMADQMNLDEKQLQEVLNMQKTLSHIVKLNKTLLLLTRIENNQFSDSVDVDCVELIRSQQEMFDDVYSSRNIVCERNLPSSFVVRMNETMASVLLSNLLKNAYVHTTSHGAVFISIKGNRLTISNSGETPLDKKRIFDRFYQGSKKEGSTGLGLALVHAVCDLYGIQIAYEYKENLHCFSLTWS